MDYQVLKVLIADLVGSDEEKAIQVNAKNIPAVKNISVADIRKRLVVTGKILGIRASTNPAAMLTIESLAFLEFEMIDSVNVEALNLQLAGLEGAGLIDPEDTAHILSLGTTLTSLAEQYGLGWVTVGDVQEAGRTV